jgi:hypothetical protein
MPRTVNSSLALLVTFVVAAMGTAPGRLVAQSHEPRLDHAILGRQNFGADAVCCLRSIPFLEIDDPEIQQIYYYRWMRYRAHLREIGPQGTTVLELALYRSQRFRIVPYSRRPIAAQSRCG